MFRCVKNVRKDRIYDELIWATTVIEKVTT